MSFIQQFFTSRDNNANAETFVGQQGRLWWNPETNQIYSSDGNTPGGIPLAGGGGGNGTPGGANSQVQFNQNGAFGGTANLTIDRTTGALTAVSFVGNGAALTSITGANVTGSVANATYAVSAGSSTTATSAVTAGTVTTDNQPNITSVGTLTGVTSTGNISTTGNVVGNYFIGNGSLLTGMATNSYSNSNVTALLAALGSNVISSSANISTTGNITGAYYFGNGFTLSSVAGANVTGIVPLANISNYATTAVTALTANEANAIFGSNVVGQVAYAAVANSVAGANVSGAVANATYAISAGSASTAGTANSVAGANVSGTVANATYALSANSATSLVNGSSVVLLNSDGTMVFPNNVINSNTNPITLWSTDSSKLLWRDSAGGAPGLPVQTTITAGNGTATITVSTGVLGLQSLKTWAFNTTGNVVFPDATVQTTAYPGTANTLTLIGNITGGNVLTGGLISVTGNITGGNIIGTHVGNLTGTTASLSGNVTGGNILTGGSVSATGNIGAGGNPNYYGFATTTKAITVVAPTSGYAAVDVVGSAGNAGSVNFGNVGTRHASIDTDSTRTLYLNVNVLGTGNAVSQAVAIYPNLNASFSNAISATANVTGGNILTSGLISATANVTGGNVLTGGLISATGNITGGNTTTTGAVYSNFNTNTANTASFNATGGNTKGGTGYLDFLVAQNTSGGATNPYKWLRVNPTGGLEVINSAYTTNIFNLTDAGALSVPIPYQVAGKQAVNGPAFSAYPTSPAQTITSGSQQRVNMGNEVYDTANCYDAPNGRFTPNVEGYYQLEATVRIDGSSGTGEYMIIIWKNGAEYKRGTNGSGTEIGASFFPLQVSCQAYANGSTDYFEVYVQQTSGSNRTVSPFEQISYFQGMMVRGA
jgi:hypothetical protein